MEMNFLFKKLSAINSEVLSKKLEYYRTLEKTNRFRQGIKLEHALCRVIEDFLPERYGVTNGKIFDRKGNISRQIDIIIYDKMFCSNLIYEDATDRYIAIESVRHIIEVKSKFSNKAYNDMICNLESVRGLARYYRPYLPGVYIDETYIPPVTYSLFCFEGKRNMFDELEINFYNTFLKYTKKACEFFPNMIVVNNNGIYQFMEADMRDREKNDNEYRSSLPNAYGKKDCMFGFTGFCESTLNAFLFQIVEDADNFPPLTGHYTAVQVIGNSWDANCKTKRKYNFSNA